MRELSKVPELFFLLSKISFIRSNIFNFGSTRQNKLGFDGWIGDAMSAPFHRILVLDFYHFPFVTLGNQNIYIND